jgi:RND family efflux transporter MFP subunit
MKGDESEMRTHKLAIGGAVALAVGALVVVGLSAAATPAFSAAGIKEAPSVRIARATTQELVQQVSVTGTLEPAGFQEARAEFAAGRVRFLVGAGDRIKAGQVLAQLDTDQQQQLVAGLEAVLAKAQAHLAELKWQQQMEPSRQAQKIAAAEVALAQAEQEVQNAIAAVSQQVGQARLAVLAIQSRQAELAAQLEEARGQVVQAEAAQRLKPENLAARQAVDQTRLAYDTLLAGSAGTSKELSEELAQAQEALRIAEQSAQPANLESALPVRSARLKVESARQALAAAQAETSQSGVLAQQILAAQADLTMAMQSLAVARTKLQHAVITAPFDGVLVSVALKEGQTVQENEVLLGLSATSQLTLTAQVNEKDVTKIEPGQDFMVETGNYPGVVFPGKIVRVPVLPAQENGAGSGTFFAVQGLLRNPEGKLRPGMKVEASITSAERAAVITIPVAAIREAGGKTYAVVIKDFQARVRQVKLGLRTDKQAEVLEGLFEGDMVVTAPTRLIQTLKDGDRVRLDSAELELGQLR